MDAPGRGFVYAGTREELEAQGRIVVRGRHRPILVVHDCGRVFALDNRCPHMGFPLARGSLDDGILTCHWHHARFDVASGCTFDLWADDLPTCPVVERNGAVWVKPESGYADPVGHWCHRLDDGLAHGLDLVVAKATQGLLDAGIAPAEVLCQIARFGARNRDRWGTGLTILTALGNLLPYLAREDCSLALFHAARAVAQDCAGEPPRRAREALDTRLDGATLKRWFQRWTAVRHRDGAERTLATAVGAGTSPADLAGMLFAAAADRPYSDDGHTVDFANKALECLDLVGWSEAGALLPTVVPGLAAARGAEERTAWRQPVDLIAVVDAALAELPERRRDGMRRQGKWGRHTDLADAILGGDPDAIVAALLDAVTEGAGPADLGCALSYAAGLRVARFGTANELSDWETAHHAFTHANAVHQALARVGDAAMEGGAAAPVRAVFHGAMAVYLARYLNVPPAALPDGTGMNFDDEARDAEGLRAALLAAFDRQSQVDRAGGLVARYLALGHSPPELIATLGHALLREDAGFHSYQMLEAGVRQFQVWGNRPEGRHMLVAAARYLAAHWPTRRGALQTADIARRLLQGGQLHGAGEEARSAAATQRERPARTE